MKINRIFLTLLMLFALSLTQISFASSIVPNTSGEISTSGETSASGEGNPSSSGETSIISSGETSTSGEEPSVMKLRSKALDSELEVLENQKLTAKFKAEIVSGEKVFYAITNQPAHGVVTQSGEHLPDFVYTPNKDYTGTDKIAFRLESGDRYSNAATVTITVKQDSSTVIPFNYIDMKEHWANYSASHLAARGLIIGEEIGNRFYFNPERTMTRGEFMLFLLSITESNLDAEVDVKSSIFADKDSIPSWLLEAAKVAYSKKIIKGSDEGGKIYLNLNKPITRVEAVTMISNVLGTTTSTKEITYKDVGSIPSWALNAVKSLTAYKIVQGDSENMFNPHKTLTRAEAAELSFKLLKQLELNNLSNGSGDIK